MSEIWLGVTQIGIGWIPAIQIEMGGQQSDFWLRVLQTVIGSFAGFLLGIVAFWFQQRRQANNDEAASRKASLDALSRLSMTAGANIEALAQAKLQFVNDMQPEIEKMKVASTAAYDALQADQSTGTYEDLKADLEAKLTELKAISGSLRHFYQSLPSTSVMAPPDVAEYSTLSNDMPALPLFVHRAMGMTQQLNERIASRNALISEHARESGNGKLSSQRLLFFAGMLSDEGTAIYTHVDDALYCWKLVADQVKAYMTKKAKGEHFVEYELVPKATEILEALPMDEMFPRMLKQLVTFEDDPKK